MADAYRGGNREGRLVIQEEVREEKHQGEDSANRRRALLAPKKQRQRQSKRINVIVRAGKVNKNPVTKLGTLHKTRKNPELASRRRNPHEQKIPRTRGKK